MFNMHQSLSGVCGSVGDFAAEIWGEVMNPHIYKSVEFALDEDALDIVRNSPKWNPARQNGHVVKSYKRQPFMFRIPE